MNVVVLWWLFDGAVRPYDDVVYFKQNCGVFEVRDDVTLFLSQTVESFKY